MATTSATHRQPPLVPGLPVLGNALAMKDDLIPFLTRSYQRYGSIFRVRALNQELVVLAGPEANIFVTQQGADKFRSYEAWTGYGREFGVEQSLQNIDGELHTKMRKLLKVDFSSAKMLSNIPLMVSLGQDAVERLPDGTVLPALTLFRSIVTEQLGRLMASTSPEGYHDDIVTVVRVALNVLVNHLWPKSALRASRYQNAKKRFIEFGRSIVAHHRATGGTQGDLVDTVLRASKDPDYQFAFGDEAQIIFMTIAPFVAGLDTVSNECTFMLYALLENPELYAECVRDADRLFSEGMPTLSALKHQGPLHHAMMETLRRYSIAPGVDRTAAQDFEFGGYQVKEGQRVFIATTVSHFLPDIFREPFAFDSKRFEEPRREHKRQGAYAPFGIGTHTCLGAGAAEVQMLLVMATVLHATQLERANPKERLAIKTDPTPTLGPKFAVRLVRHRNHIAIPEGQLQQMALEAATED